VRTVNWPEEAAMSTPASPQSRRSDHDLADEVEDLGFGLMLFAGAAIALSILVLIIVL
jgi:hypothetical protein